jgi:uncharacterized membrane protein YdjX (TVP38/TMEM64 family)
VKEELLRLFQQHAQWAVAISLLLSVIIAVLGVVPSVFVTAANILFFGFWEGIALSFAGEALGAVVSFWLYRKGFKKGIAQSLHRFPKLQQLVNAEGKRAFGLIFSLRLLPFVPSGLVTFAAATGKVSVLVFVTASSLGKVPALLLEGYSVHKVTAFDTEGKIILALAAMLLLFFLLRRKKEA